MERIKTPTRWIDKFAPPAGVGRDGFRDGDPVTGQSSTQLEADWFDQLQEEVARAIEGSGLTLDPNNMSQLWEAIQREAGRYVLKAGDTMTGQLIAPSLRSQSIVEIETEAGAIMSIFGNTANNRYVAFFGPQNAWLFTPSTLEFTLLMNNLEVLRTDFARDLFVAGRVWSSNLPFAADTAERQPFPHGLREVLRLEPFIGGLIPADVRQIIPEAVKDDRYIGEAPIVHAMINAIKELDTRLTALEGARR